jgi:hypothetical protein
MDSIFFSVDSLSSGLYLSLIDLGRHYFGDDLRPRTFIAERVNRRNLIVVGFTRLDALIPE